MQLHVVVSIVPIEFIKIIVHSSSSSKRIFELIQPEGIGINIGVSYKKFKNRIYIQTSTNYKLFIRTGFSITSRK